MLKVILTGLLWSMLYFTVVGKGLYAFFGYTPFFMDRGENPATLEYVFKDWIFLFQIFMSGRWSIQKTKDWLLVLSFLAFFPVWLYGWWMLIHVSWKKKWESFRGLRPAKEIKKVPIVKKKRGLQRPPPLSAQTFSVAPVNHQQVPALKESGMPNELDEFDSSEKTTSVPVMDMPKITPEKAFEQISEIGKSFGFDVLENISIADTVIPMVLATPDQAFLVRLFNTPDKEWIADEMGEEPVWFYASGQEISPFYNLKKVADAFAKEEPDSEIKPLLVVIGGTIINGEDMIPDWDNQGGMVVRLNDLTNNGMLTLQEYLQQEKDKKGGVLPDSETWEEAVEQQEEGEE